MKKYIFITLLVFCGMMFGTLALAAQIPSDGTSIGSSTFIPSTNVTVDVISLPATYCVTSQHRSAIDPVKGARQFGARSSDSVIMKADANSSGEPTACADASTFGTGNWAQ